MIDARSDKILQSVPMSSDPDITRQFVEESKDSTSTESGTEEVAQVLIADENPTVRKILRHMLESLNCETIEACDGEQVLKLAQAHPRPQAIIINISLPKGSGFEICSQLKSDEFFRLLPIILLTDADDPEEKLRALEAGADDFLRKPINRAELTFRMRALLRMRKCNQELVGAESVALALARAVAAKDGYSHSHVERVSSLASMLAESMGLDSAEIKIIRFGAILHNVGKISIPDTVLEKTGKLTPREKALFQQHPLVGCDICAPLKSLQPVLPIIRHHKERWNGTGYPDGLRGSEIPLGAQIVGLVDTYVALMSDRPFRKAISSSEVMEQLREQVSSGLFSPELTEQFITCLEEQEASRTESQATVQCDAS